MTSLFDAISPWPVTLAATDLHTMIDVSRALFHLSTVAAYQQRVSPFCPEVVQFVPNHDAVMMGYDFHLTAQGPKLIEVNTNAGGVLPAWLAHARHYGLPDAMPTAVQARLLQTFAKEWQGFAGSEKPQGIAIVDETPAQQHLYPEMLFFAELFRTWGVPTVVCDPKDLTLRDRALYHHQQKIELIYNRHTDFYLDSDPLAAIRQAYLQRRCF